MFYSLKFFFKYFRIQFLKARFFNKKIRFLRNVKIDNKCYFEGFNSIGENNTLSNIRIGRGTYTGTSCSFNSVNIGRFCSIGSNVKNIVGRHPTETFVSTHPSFFSPSYSGGFTFAKSPLFAEKVFLYDDILVEIGNDVWIGENVIIFDNVKIGNGAIIGANSLVNKDIPAYSINVGSPAKIIKYRFSNNIISELEKFKWWENDFKWLEDNYLDFSNIDYFTFKYFK